MDKQDFINRMNMLATEHTASTDMWNQTRHSWVFQLKGVTYRVNLHKSQCFFAELAVFTRYGKEEQQWRRLFRSTRAKGDSPNDMVTSMWQRINNRLEQNNG